MVFLGSSSELIGSITKDNINMTCFVEINKWKVDVFNKNLQQIRVWFCWKSLENLWISMKSKFI